MKNADKTHCKRGHEFTVENTKQRVGYRQCRTCIRERNRIGPAPKSVAERFWDKVDKSAGQGPKGECWQWIGETSEKGYGRLKVKGKNTGAHRLSYALHNEQFDTSLFICHHCDNPSCVNPTHLFADTQLGNMRDKVQKGRLRNGSEKIIRCKCGGEYATLASGKRICKPCVAARNAAWHLVNRKGRPRKKTAV